MLEYSYISFDSFLASDWLVFWCVSESVGCGLGWRLRFPSGRSSVISPVSAEGRREAVRLRFIRGGMDRFTTFSISTETHVVNVQGL